MHGMEHGKMEGEDKAAEVSAKDKAKVAQAHDVIMSIADKYDMSMEEIVDACCEEEDGQPEEDISPEEKPAVDKAKIALIIGKMRGGGGHKE